MYDRAGRLTRLTGYTGPGTTGAQHTVYAYNKAGLQTRVTYPDDEVGDRGYVDYAYDAAQRLTRINDQNNENTDIAYDSMGRRLTVTKGTEIDTFAYAAPGTLTLAQRGTSGNPDATSKVERLYDGLLRLTRESQSIKESTARHVDYAYDKAANVLTLGYPSGVAIQTSYDVLNRGDIIKQNGSQIADYAYLGGRVKTLTYETGANDVVLTMAYDGAVRLTRMAYAQTGSTGLPDFTYRFDAGSNITRKTFENMTGDPSEDYNYDTLHRLTRTTFGQRDTTPYEGFVYDHLGNHLTQDENGAATAGLFNTVNEQTKRGDTDVLYDKRGNLTRDDDGCVYFYDRENMLTRVEQPSGTLMASYTYDVFGRRIEKSVSGSNASHFWWNGPHIIEESDDAATPVLLRKFVWGVTYDDDLLQFIDSRSATDVAYFACRHHNFNLVALLDGLGVVVERYDYEPYGRRYILDAEYDELPSSECGNPVGHQGLMHDEETNLVYNRARMLNTTLRRFMQRDSSEYIDGLHLYSYVGNNPAIYLDPLGLARWCERDAIRLEVAVPKIILSVGKKLGIHQIKAKIHGEYKVCEECCANTHGQKTYTERSFSLGYLVIAEFGSPEFKIWKLKARIGWYGRITGSGQISAGYSRCEGAYGGGCGSLSGEAGFIGEATAGKWGGGARGGVNVTVKVCGTCSQQSGCAATVQLCGDIRGRFWGKANIGGWKLEYFHEWQYGDCTGKWPVPGIN